MNVLQYAKSRLKMKSNICIRWTGNNSWTGRVKEALNVLEFENLELVNVTTDQWRTVLYCVKKGREK